MEPLTLALISAGISAGTQAIGAGLERRAGSQAAAEAFTEEEAERLRQLQALQAAGQLGLTEEQAGVLEAQARTQQAAQARLSQAERLAAQAARPASARDVFLQQAAAEAARQQAVIDEGLLRQQAEQQAAAAQQAEIQQLLLQRARAAALESGGAGAGIEALGTGAAQALDVLGAQAQQTALEEARLEALLEEYQPEAVNPYGAYV